MKKVYIAILLVAAINPACTKQAPEFCTDAVVVWGGDPAADGLGWYLLADSVQQKLYIPLNLPDSMQINYQPVHACMYKTPELFYCECAHPLPKYKITSITKR